MSLDGIRLLVWYGAATILLRVKEMPSVVTLRKILLYGGCHALVLRDLFATYFSDRVAATLLINFEVIREGKPFPYEQLKNYDVVFYSPIENKGEYNTEHLAEACLALGVDAICFPWLEWHGYCPGAIKGEFKNRFQWRYPALVEAASTFESFELFTEWVIEAFPDDALIDTCFEKSMMKIRSSEERHGMAIRISDFIDEHYQDSRLFLVSDHPSLVVYLHVFRKMLELLKLEADSARERLMHSEPEPQWRWRTPILPRVAERLHLRFSDTRWVDDDVVPGRSLDLRSYLLLYFHSNSVILGPIGAAGLSSLSSEGGERQVEPGTRLVADRLSDRRHLARHRYRLLEVLSGDAMTLKRNQRFEIDDRQWRSAWG